MAVGGSDVWRAAGGAARRRIVFVSLRQPGLAAVLHGIFRCVSAGRLYSCSGYVYLLADEEPDCGGGDRLRISTVSLDTELEHCFRQFHDRPGAQLSFDHQSSGHVYAGSDRYQRPGLLPLHDFPWVVSDATLARVVAVEGCLDG